MNIMSPRPGTPGSRVVVKHQLLRMVSLGILVYLLPHSAAGSVRMSALGSGLEGIIDDRTTDLPMFPQQAQSARKWLAGLNMPAAGTYVLYAVSPGPVSFGGFVDATLSGDDPPDGRPAVLASFRTGRIPWGAYVVLTDAYWASPPEEASGDSIVGGRVLDFDMTYRLGTTLSQLWAHPDMTLTVSHRSWGLWHEDTQHVWRRIDGQDYRMAPGVRFTFGDDFLRQRVLIEYEYWKLLEKAWRSREEDGHIGRLKYGLEVHPGKGVLLACAVAGYVARNKSIDAWAVDASLPVAIEVPIGPLKLRLGCSLNAHDQIYRGRGTRIFTRYLTAGFGAQPFRGFRLDFAANTENAANLRTWGIGASYEF